jgi:hypothetical protein
MGSILGDSERELGCRLMCDKSGESVGCLGSTSLLRLPQADSNIRIHRYNKWMRSLTKTFL